MDQQEVEYIIYNCSPSRPKNSVSPPHIKCPSPNSIALYPASSRLVRVCKNCLFSFRTEFRPDTQFCNKDCETSFYWFKKRCDIPCSSIKPADIKYEPYEAIPESKSLPKTSSCTNDLNTHETENINSNIKNECNGSGKLTRCHLSWKEEQKPTQANGFNEVMKMFKRLLF